MRGVNKKNLQKLINFVSKESDIKEDEYPNEREYDNYIEGEYKLILKDSLDFNKKYIFRK